MIKLTGKASSVVKTLIAEAKQKGEIPNEIDIALRVMVQGGGCSGFQYKLGFVDSTQLEDDDKLTEEDGVKVIIDSKSNLYMDGTTIDYQDGLGGKGFTFSNPGETGHCGCGSSFSA